MSSEIRHIFMKEIQEDEIIDTWKKQSPLNKHMILDYLMFQFGKHVFVISKSNLTSTYLISEIEKADKNADMVDNTLFASGRNKMVDYLKQLRIRSIEQ